MKRQVSLAEISDGKLYDRNDMVRAGCNGCRDCCECCGGMGNSVVLDPLDMFRLTTGLSQSFEELLNDKIELTVVDGIILPCLKMSGSVAGQKEACAFLDGSGRCSIHLYRPGICRLFPLGRYYEKEKRSFRYFLQIHECPMPNRTKVKVEKWMDTPHIARYEQFVKDWHYFLEDVQERVSAEQDEGAVKNVNLFVLKLFFVRPYQKEADFYTQFEERMAAAREVLS